jgi:enoyl-CoA hydratase/carnithine racemase
MTRTTLVDLPSSLSAEWHDHIAVLCLSRPEKRNAIDLTMVHGIDRFFSAFTKPRQPKGWSWRSW